jgi:hypothetical protein
MEWPLKTTKEILFLRHGEYNPVGGSLTEKGKSQLIEIAKITQGLDVQGKYLTTLSSVEMRAVNTTLFLRDNLYQGDEQHHFTNWLFTHPYLCDHYSEKGYNSFIDFLNTIPGGPFLAVTHSEFMETFPFTLFKNSFGTEISREKDGAYRNFGCGEGIFINSSGDCKPIYR